MACIAQIVGGKDTGKTAVLEKVIRVLKDRGFRVAVIKHSHHVIDLQGKDTYRLRESGSDVVILKDPKGLTGFFVDPSFVNCLQVDVILLEGFKDFKAPIRVEIASPEEIDAKAEEMLRVLEPCLRKTLEPKSYLSDLIRLLEQG
ncbi:MAG: molybdopterin-guanine dinucleotide biosynthesis protein B [Thermoprotei archaeon]